MVGIVGRVFAIVILIMLLAGCRGDGDSSGDERADTPASASQVTREVGSPVTELSQALTRVPATATVEPTLTASPTASPDSIAPSSGDRSESLAYVQLAAWDADWQMLGGMAIGPDGRLYVSDSERNQLAAFAADGSLVTTLEYPLPDPGPDLAFDDVAVGPDGGIYVLENSTTTRVIHLNPDGAVASEWGGLVGFEEDSIFEAKAIAVTPSGHIFLAGGGGGARLQKFTTNGAFVAAWDHAGDYLFPRASRFDLAISDETLYVASDGYWHDRLAILPFDFEGNLSSEPIILAERDVEPIVRLGSLAVGPAGNLFVADPVSREIVVLSPAGEALTRWMLEGEGPEFAYRLEVAVGADGRVYVADDLSKAIVVYGRATS